MLVRLCCRPRLTNFQVGCRALYTVFLERSTALQILGTDSFSFRRKLRIICTSRAAKGLRNRAIVRVHKESELWSLMRTLPCPVPEPKWRRRKHEVGAYISACQKSVQWQLGNTPHGHTHVGNKPRRLRPSTFQLCELLMFTMLKHAPSLLQFGLIFLMKVR